MNTQYQGNNSDEQELRRRKQKHLEDIKHRKDDNFQPCLHDGCSECIGTGVKEDGSPCVHYISCPCPKCSVTY